MNDFTKEELEYISRSLAFYCHLEDELIIDPIIDKVKSMIDNYDAQSIEVWHCEKCGHVQ